MKSNYFTQPAFSLKEEGMAFKLREGKGLKAEAQEMTLSLNCIGDDIYQFH